MAFTPKFYVASTKEVLTKAISLGLFTYPGICYIKDKHNLAWMLDTNIPSIIYGENQVTDMKYNKDDQTLKVYSGEAIIFEEKIECSDEQINSVVAEILTDYYRKSETESLLINLNEELGNLINDLQETLSHDIEIAKTDINEIKTELGQVQESIPNKISDLENDSEFVTASDVNDVVVESMNSDEGNAAVKAIAAETIDEEVGPIKENVIRSWFQS